MPAATQAPTPLVEMRGIVKRFPGVLALDRVDFELRPGEVHVLLGENGAGKSTLVKVLSGACPADAGEILIQGERVHITSPQVPLRRGLRFIYQEISLVPQTDIARNLFLGAEPRRWGLVDRGTLYGRAAELLRQFHMDMDPRQVVGELSVTQQKMVEIARALVAEAKALVLDEPTDVLDDRSRSGLFEVIRRLRASHQVGFVYISHRYEEVHELGDRVTILRDGRNVGTHRLADLTLDGMIEKMIGGQLKTSRPAVAAPGGEDALRVTRLSRRGVLHDISLAVRRGEIVGVTGLTGAGKTELARAIAGVDPFDAGEIAVHGQPVRCATPAQAIRSGIAYLTEDRKAEGLILDQTLRDNLALPSLGRASVAGIVRRRLLDDEAREFMGRLAIKAPGIHTLAGQLSGGNQQKLVLAKWLAARCKILLFDEPTRGIDIRGRAEVYRIMEELLDQGAGILVFTSDYAEALALSHRILVLRRGSIAREFRRGEASEEEILRVAIGAA